jgi:uncharacterized delta-60 repeat protein
MRKGKSPSNQLIGTQRFLWHRSFVLAIVILLLAWPASRSVGADAGDLDSTFGIGGKITLDFFGLTDLSEDMIIQPDGKVVAVGFTVVNNTAADGDFALVRLNQDGSLDSTFGSGGKVIFDFFGTSDFANAVSLQSDGKIVAAGSSLTTSSGGNSVFAVARFNPDGSVDSSFGTGGKVITEFSTRDDRINDMAIQADGKIVVGGFTTNTLRPSRDIALARYNPDGSLDATFGSGGTVITDFNNEGGEINSLALQSDGKIVVAGRAATGGDESSPAFTVARYNADGSLDAAFGSGGAVLTDFPGNEDVANAVVIQNDGKIVAAGTVLDTVSFQLDFVVARYSSDGSFDTTFGNGGIVTTDFFGDWDLAFALALQPDGKIVAAGSAATDGLDDFALARYNTDGSLDTTFSIDGKTTTDFSTSENVTTGTLAIALQADGRIVAAGSNDNGDFTLARYLGVTSANTPVGDNVVVQPVDSTTGGTPALLTFSQVTQAGDTSLTTSGTGPAPPSGFNLGDPPTYYDLTTTAAYSGSIMVCISYTGISFADESSLRLFHFEGDVWADVTTSLDTGTDVICGSVTSLSPFAIFEPVSGETKLFYLHGTGPNSNPQTIFLDNTAPTATSAKFKDSAAVNFSGGNPWKEIGTWPAASALTTGTLTALDDLHVWLGLKNSDDQGTRFDLRVEVYKNTSLVAADETYCIDGVTRNPGLAREVTVMFGPFSPAVFNGATDRLSLKVLTRIGTNGAGGFCGGHSNAGGLRLYFDAVSRPAKLSTDIFNQLGLCSGVLIDDLNGTFGSALVERPAAKHIGPANDRIQRRA